jgi:hypothetical protein
MTNGRNSNRIALEVILLLIYAWNSCPVCSMIALGCKFSFPINFSTGKHAKLYSALGTVDSYSKQLAT